MAPSRPPLDPGDASAIAGEAWPPLSYAAWKDTRTTLHLWMQVVGKVALARAPPLNHCWGVALRVTPRGLATRTLSHGERSFAIAFDFIDQCLRIACSDGGLRTLELRPRSVADFHHELMAALDALRLPVSIRPVSVELPEPVRLDRDRTHATYDGEAARRFWRALVQIDRVFDDARCGFVGKSSPVHFFWGSFDLAMSRFSGRRAPPRAGPVFERDAYSHEVISHGFWPGDERFPEAAFYAYAVPPPAGFATAQVRPPAARFEVRLGEFVLPYEAVRGSDAPGATLAAFVDSTYRSAADLGGWDRAALERDPG